MQIHKLLRSLFFVPLFTIGTFTGFAQDVDPQLQDLIQKGIEKNRTLKINVLNQQQAEQDVKLAKSTFLPKLTLNASYTRLNDDLTFDEETQDLLKATQKLLIKEAAGMPFNMPFPEGIDLREAPNLQDKDIFKSSVDLDWVLFSGLEATHAIKASKHKSQSLKYLGQAEKDKLAMEIVEAYDQLALVYASEKVLNTTEEYLQEQEYYIKKAIKLGLTTPLSRKKIELAKQQLEGKKIEFNNSKTLLIENLNQLTGVEREELRELKPRLIQVKTSLANDTEVRNEIKALEEAEQATIQKSKMLKSNFIPKVAMKGRYEFIERDLSLLDPRWYIGVGVKWNVFDGNQSRIKAKKTQLESLAYREKIEEAQEMIALSIVKAQMDYNAKSQTVQTIQKELEIAEETYQLVNQQYKNNLAAITDVLDALTDVEKSHFKYQEAVFKQRKARNELLHAQGNLQY